MTVEQLVSAHTTRKRVRAEVEASRALMTRADNRNRVQKRYMADVIGRTRQLLSASINAWPAAHGLDSTAGDRRYEDVLGLVLEAAATLYDGCRLISLTSVDQLSGDQGSHRTAASTGNSSTIDGAQYRLAEGPCIDAVELDLIGAVHADDLAATGCVRSWPRFSEAAETLGVRSSLSISLPWSAFRTGLQAQQRAVAAINLYSHNAHAFDTSEVQVTMFGCWAGAVLSGKEPDEVYEVSL